jgi:hypothetical protein
MLKLLSKIMGAVFLSKGIKFGNWFGPPRGRVNGPYIKQQVNMEQG